ncbi:MAG: HDIG domain-containing protein [Bacteroidaceae bacterium]|nr:HDIG domain-containing protein [Bacteroidaceae bacterium]
MSRYNNRHPLTRAGLLYRIGLASVAIALIVYFLPREQSYTYQFELDRPWKYGQLIASFDFPIYKDEAVVKQEQDSVMKQFHPYFVKDNQVGKSQQRKLREVYTQGSLKETLDNLTGGGGERYYNHIMRTLGEIYERGIIDTHDLLKLKEDSTQAIMLTENNTARPVKTSALLTVKEAYKELTHADTARYNLHTMQQCNLQDYLVANLTYDKEKSQAAELELLSTVSWSSGMVINGTKIIDRGEIINKQTYDILQSLSKELDKRRETTTQKRLTLAGQVLFVAILMACFILYLDLFRRDYYERKRTILLLMGLIVFFPIVTSLMMTHNVLNVYLIPFAMLPIIVRVFMDSRTAFMANVTMLLLCSIVLRYPYEFLLVQFIGGLVGIYSLRELSQRSQLVRAALQVTLSMMLVYFAYELIHTNDLTKLDTSMYISLVINGILLLFTYPLLFVLEKAFGFTSNVTLVELSNINTPLLRKMSEVAPGTFQHSLQVANLAAEAAREIGANSQLVRTGALYHDIGKIENPVFFTENQSGVNPHKTLDFAESAHIIINHVTDGLKLADKHDLPAVIRNFIRSHHGVGMTKYFYISEQNAHPDEEVDKSLFTYPGPNPATQEEAILMMADAVEAASRSLPEYTEESISNLVDRLIDTQVADGAFRQCTITFRDIETAKSVFKEKLKTVYHTRISYPELKK